MVWFLGNYVMLANVKLWWDSDKGQMFFAAPWLQQECLCEPKAGACSCIPVNFPQEAKQFRVLWKGSLEPKVCFVYLLCSCFCLPCPPRQHAALSEYRPILPRAPALQPRTALADKKLVLIPVIFIVLRIWSTIRFILTLCNSPAVQNPVLVVLHVSVGQEMRGEVVQLPMALCGRCLPAPAAPELLQRHLVATAGTAAGALRGASCLPRKQAQTRRAQNHSILSAGEDL